MDGSTRLARRHLSRVFTLALAFLFTGAAWSTTSGRAAIVVRDDAGRDVVLPKPAARIVSLAPHTTELLYEIGAGPRVVGATAYSDFPTAARRLPRVGGLAGIDLEALVALRPDLVVAWQSGTAAAQLDRIEALGIPVFRSEPHVFDDIASTQERLGILVGDAVAGAAAARTFRARVASLKTDYSTRPSVRVFYQVWRDPLMTVGGSQLISQAIALCGGRNVFEALTTLAPQVDVEAVIRADPQVIATTSGEAGADHRADLDAWQRWPGVEAVRARRFVFLDPALISRQSSRMLTGTETLCRAIDAARSH